MRNRRTGALLLLLVAFSVTLFCADANSQGLPQGFVYVEEVIPGIEIELRYFTDNNFIGRKVDGYLRPRCILTKQAARALKKVQEELNQSGLGLKIYDAYRPQRAVDHFIRWSKDLNATKMKSVHYPDVKKENLFKDGYIAARSSHSRGSAVDVTIVSIAGPQAGAEIDMGTDFDFFGPKSWLDNRSVSPSQRAHRLLLHTVMRKHGFKSYPKEWWHFSLMNEPYPRTYFDFPVQ